MDPEVHQPRKINGGMVALVVAIIGLAAFITGLAIGMWIL